MLNCKSRFNQIVWSLDYVYYIVSSFKKNKNNNDNKNLFFWNISWKVDLRYFFFENQTKLFVIYAAAHCWCVSFEIFLFWWINL